MTTKVVRIERVSPPKGSPEMPFKTAKGYKMADPKFGRGRHLSEHALFRKTLEEVALELERGMHLWMKQEGKRETLISPHSLRVTFA